MLAPTYKKRRFYDDDFDWDNYTNDSYERRLRVTSKVSMSQTFTRRRQRSILLLAVS